MKDKLGSNTGKAIVFVLIGLMTIGLVLGASQLDDASGHLTLNEIMEGTDYYSSYELAEEITADANDSLHNILADQKYLDSKGKLDEKAEIDISQLQKGIHCKTPDPATTYTIGDLLAMRESAGYRKFVDQLENAEYENFEDMYLYEDSENLLKVVPDEGLDEETIKKLDLTGFSPAFCYLYAKNRPFEIVRPKSGVLLADHALLNATTVSLLENYRQLQQACDEVYAFKKRLSITEAQSSGANPAEKEPLAYYFYHDLTADTVITNSAAWEGLSDTELNTILNEAVKNEQETYGAYMRMLDRQWEDVEFYQLDSEAQNIVMDRAYGIMEEMTDGYGIWAVILNPDYTAAVGRYDPSVIRAQVADQVGGFRNGLLVCGICGILLVVLGILSLIQVARVYDPMTLRTGDYVVRKGHVSDEHPEIREYVELHAPDEPIPVRRSSYLTAQTPIEILLLVDVLSWVLYACVVTAVVDLLYSSVEYGVLVAAAVVIAGFITLALWQTLTLFSKIKSHNFLTHSIIRAFFRWIGKLFYSRSLTWQMLIVFGFVGLVMLIGGLIDGGFGVFVMFFLWITLFVLHMVKRGQKQKLMDGIREIAGGNLYYKLDESAFAGNEKIMAVQMNNIRNGMQAAIDEQMKAERLRTDLITNVSHDIKTPLTSIINYVDLLKREHIEDPKIAGYVEVLDQKSARLKQLTEDLVEASKISSGNIVLNYGRLDLVQMVKQMNGEYEERFEERGLQVVTRFPEGEMCIWADGARMNRVLDNLYGNAAKYAMPGSRIYITISELSGRIRTGATKTYCVLSIKNVSEQELNVSAEELMERFVRGDVSRTTEGSGLGLEIAGNLTKMQGGTFDLSVDGDLFKVELAFPRV